MERVQLNLSLDRHDVERIRAEASRRGVSIAQLVRDAVFGSASGSSFDAQEAYEDLDRRLRRLEEMAGL